MAKETTENIELVVGEELITRPLMVSYLHIFPPGRASSPSHTLESSLASTRHKSARDLVGTARSLAEIKRAGMLR